MPQTGSVAIAMSALAMMVWSWDKISASWTVDGRP
jgi:hypothetical protein